MRIEKEESEGAGNLREVLAEEVNAKRGEKGMEERKETVAERLLDAKEFAELLQGLTHDQKREIKGVLIGLKMAQAPEEEKTA